jgi:hypothetical protein
LLCYIWHLDGLEYPFLKGSVSRFRCSGLQHSDCRGNWSGSITVTRETATWSSAQQVGRSRLSCIASQCKWWWNTYEVQCKYTIC